VATWHGAGPVATQRISIQRALNYEHEKALVKEVLNLREKGEIGGV